MMDLCKPIPPFWGELMAAELTDHFLTEDHSYFRYLFLCS
jgi:hypothetical protein